MKSSAPADDVEPLHLLLHPISLGPIGDILPTEAEERHNAHAGAIALAA